MIALPVLFLLSSVLPILPILTISRREKGRKKGRKENKGKQKGNKKGREKKKEKGKV